MNKITSNFKSVRIAHEMLEEYTYQQSIQEKGSMAYCILEYKIEAIQELLERMGVDYEGS